MKTGELTVRMAPAGRFTRLSGALQPFLFVKVSAYRGRAVALAASVTVKAMDWKDIPLLFFSSISTHQPVPVQLSMPLYEAIKLAVEVGTADGTAVAAGTGVNESVGRGGGVYTGRTPVFPVTVANWPNSQHTSPARFGFRITQ